MSRHEIVVRALGEADVEAACAIAFQEWPFQSESYTEAMIRRDSWRERQRGFGAFAGDRLVSMARFHYRPVRIGKALLTMAGVADVVTDPEFRRRGLAKRVLSAGIAWMKSSRVAFSLLFTAVPYVYRGLGWGEVREVKLSLPMANMPRLGSGRYRTSQVTVAELPAQVADIYDRSCGAHPISVARTPEYWRALPSWRLGDPGGDESRACWTLAWKGERPVAYGLAGRSEVSEMGALPGEEEALSDVFDALVARMRRSKPRERLQLDIPLDHPLVLRITPLVKRDLALCGMVLVVDLPALLEELRPELEARWQSPEPARLRLESPVGSATVTLARGKSPTLHSYGDGALTVDDGPGAAVIRLTPSGLASLLLGFQSARDLKEQGEIEAEPDTIELANQLFPWVFSHFWEIDKY